ncbi:T9SS type A sorting domain-containing protein [Chryseobacterium formosus]|uniref:T9SS type A sorting domain-containing protein n=1 Tax=Chryseobacterium formosus TaxID=1537363 RepID=A0ABT3XN09_9FLAO|nr:T9SS type A sorting domain-containing protein [Chryseobacterium formosus]MCX8523521.1 T9SS type A sorting domain-containing protein [Chryseobacterium formosus]
MNLKLQKLSKMSMAFLMALFSVWGWGQTTIFSESMGTSSTNPLVNNYQGFQNYGSLTFTGDPNTDVRATGTLSSTSAYAGASGSNFVLLSTTSKYIQISGINTQNYTNLTLSFGVRKGTNATTQPVKVEVSADGTNYTTLTYTNLTTGSGSTGWYYRTVSGTIPATSNLRIKFTGSADSSSAIDDVKLVGSVPTCTTPTFSFVSASINKTTADGVFTNTFTSDNTSPKVWSSSDAAVATVDSNGQVTILGVGSTNIVVTQVADGTHCAVSTSYPLTVTAPTYAISATSNNNSFGATSVSGNVITATPALGYTYATPAYTIISGSATVSQAGNEFTVTPSAATQIQINFEAKPTYTLSLMNNGVAYANSNFPYVTYEGNTIALPSLPNCGNFTFVGWDTNNATTSTPTHAGGATYTTTGANTTLYAVYSETTGTPVQWSKVTNINNIVAGTYVIVNGGFFLPNTATGAGGSPQQVTLASKSVTVSGSTLSGVIAGDMQWDFAGTNSAMAIKSAANSANNLYNSSTTGATGIRVHTATPADSWAFETYSTGFAMLNNTRYCAVYTSGSDWRAYGTPNAANYNTNDGILDLYKKTGGVTTTYTTTTTCGANATIWDGAVWSNGNPSSTLDAYISSNYSGNGFTAQSMTVNQSTTLTINSGQTFTTGNMTNNGNIIVNDGGNFVQTVGGTYTAGTGASFVANRNSASPATKYVFWSSPVADQNLYKAYTNVPSGTAPTYVMTYDTATNLYPNVSNDDANFTANAGKGYSVKVPATNANVSFGGSAKIPNNGNVNVALSTASFGYNLIGNPYPSNIDLTAFYNANTSSIAPTMWLWDNTTGNVTTQTGNTAVNVGYATFNGPSGTWTEAPSTTGYNNATLNGIGAFAKIGQGFIVKAISAGSATFTNAIRASNTAVTLNKNLNNTEGKFWVKLTTSYGNNVTQAITYSQGASDAYDVYDSKAMGMGSDAFYSLAGTEKLVIQGRAPFNVNDVVQLGNKHFETGNFTISLSHKEGLFTNGQEIYLHDKQSGTYTNLQNGTYNFSANAGDFTNRFEIVYKLNVLSTNETEKGAFEVYRDGEDFVVRNHKNIQSVEVFDAAGRKIQQITANSKLVTVKIQAKGMYILKALSEGKEYTQKIIK